MDIIKRIMNVISGKKTKELQNQKEAEKYSQYWSKIRENKAAGMPVPQTGNPTEQQSNQVLGLTPTPSPVPIPTQALPLKVTPSKKMGLGKIAEKILSPIPSGIPLDQISQNIPNPTQVPEPSISPYPYTDPAEFFEKEILPKTDEYQIPSALAAGQYAEESGSAINKPSHNYFGLGPNWTFKDLDEGIKVYRNTIKNNLAKKGKDYTKLSALEILKLLQTGDNRYEAHNVDPMQYVNNVSNTPLWRKYDK